MGVQAWRVALITVPPGGHQGMVSTVLFSDTEAEARLDGAELLGVDPTMVTVQAYQTLGGDGQDVRRARGV